MRNRQFRNRFTAKPRSLTLSHSRISMGAAGGIGALSAQRAAAFTDRALGLMRPLQAQQHVLAQEIRRTLPAGRTSIADRAVNLAWRWEKAILELGGRGTRKWTTEQVNEIIKYGKPSNFNGQKVDRWEGHHIKNVADYPLQQGDADNIDLLTRSEHLAAHDGDWRRGTSGPAHNRGKQIRALMLRSELSALGIATGIGFGIGMAFSLLDRDASVKQHFLQGLDGAAVSGVSYIGGRLAAQLFLKTSLSKSMQFAGIGAAGSVAAAIYTYAKLRGSGVSQRHALSTTGAQLGVSLSGVFIITLAKCPWGPGGGVLAGLMYAAIVSSHFWQKSQMRKLRIKEIELLQPALEGGLP